MLILYALGFIATYLWFLHLSSLKTYYAPEDIFMEHLGDLVLSMLWPVTVPITFFLNRYCRGK